MAEAVINIAQDFSRYPSGRFRTDGPHSGQKFRDDFLMSAIRKNEAVRIVLDDVVGLPSSFLEEAFGGLVRAGFSKAEVLQKIRIVTTRPRFARYPYEIEMYIRNATPELARAG